MYRPKDWEKDFGEGFPKYEAYEAGADAMLEALKRDSPLMTPEQMKLIAPDRKFPYGHLVFIPEEG